MNDLKVFGTGRICTDIELKQTNGGVYVCNFTVAIDHYNAKEKKKEANFFSAKAFGSTAEGIYKFQMKKGDNIVLYGYLNNNEYTTKDGAKCKQTEIIVIEFSPGERKRAAEEPKASPSVRESVPDLPPQAESFFTEVKEAPSEELPF